MKIIIKIIAICFFINIITQAQTTYVWLSLSKPDKKLLIGETFKNTLSISSWNGIPSAFNIKVKHNSSLLQLERVILREENPFSSQSFINESKKSRGEVMLSCFQTGQDYSNDTNFELFDFIWKLKAYGIDSTSVITLEISDMVELDWKPVEVICYETKLDFVTKVEDNYIPKEYYLGNNYPNPFNNKTVIEYQILDKTRVILNIYNILGQLVTTLVDEVQKPGVSKIYWNGKNSNNISVSSGVYIYSIRTEKFSKSKKMLLLK